MRLFTLNATLNFTLKATRFVGILLAWLVGASSVLLASSVEAQGAAGRETVAAQDGTDRVTLHIAIGSKVMVASLKNNPTARDFASLLPLTVTLKEFGHAEKVSGTLPKRLSEQDAPAVDAGVAGDIAYYAPWGNIALYRGQGPNAAGVIKIARITSGMEALGRTGEVRATISRAN